MYHSGLLLHSWHQKQFSNSLDTDWVSYKSIQHCKYQEIASESAGIRLLPFQMLVTSSSCHWYFWLPCYKFKGSHDLRLITLRDRLTQFRKVLYLMLLVYYKEYTSGTAKCKESRGQDEWGAQGRASISSMDIPPLKHLKCVHQPASSLNYVV